jgi:hypothetical protein
MTGPCQPGSPERKFVFGVATAAFAERSARSTSASRSLIKVPVYIRASHLREDG